MILKFEFNYISNNNVLENLLEFTCKDFGIRYAIKKENSIVALYVQDDKNSTLEAFADFLSQRVPLSIFFKALSVTVEDIFPKETDVLPECTLSLPFTPCVLTRIKDENSEDYQNPFAKNEIGAIDCDSKILVLFKDNEDILVANTSGEYSLICDKIAQLLLQGEMVKINTATGIYTFGTIEHIKSRALDSFEVVATDLSVVEKMVVIKDNEIKALASFERPIIRLRVNTLYASKDILPCAKVRLGLADDALTYLICQKAFEKGVHFLYKTAQVVSTCSYCLETGIKSHREPVEVCVLENGEMLIVKGSHYASSALKGNLAKFENSCHAQFASVMQEHHLFDVKAGCFYMSKKGDDKLMFHSKERGMLDFVSFPTPSSFLEIFETISNSSESGKKLIENYRANFPHIYDVAIGTKIPENAPKSIYTLWKIVSIVMGFSENFDEASEVLISNAEMFGGKKGPRMDYYLQDKEALKSDFDAIKLVKSGMSFKLAGTDDITLSYGYMESLCYFLSDTADAYKENIGSQKIALCGSLFGVKRLCEATCKNIMPNHTICFNKELPIDILQCDD
ncbi:MAG: hypothetical protein PHW07_04465 [Sulfurospirillaceae bacterium]|nr:hypothetical protein [Sulfurospirillaceae bacterium]